MVSSIGKNTVNDDLFVWQDRLTERQAEFLHLLCSGHTNKYIGRLMGISSKTVDWYSTEVKRRMNARTLPQAVFRAVVLGVVNLNPEQKAELLSHLV